ncbi:MAG: nitronate monooxygenase [Rubrivivax sp.]|nr:nitronate monooxygenase [Rubrivivax sp.]
MSTFGSAALAQRLGSRWPLIQAPMAGVQGHALAVAVSRAGGLGSLPAAMLSPDALQGELQALNTALGEPGTPGRLPWNLNFFCHRPPTPDAAREAGWRQALAPYYAEYGIDARGILAGAGRAPFSEALADRIEPFQPPVLSFHFGLPEPALLARVRRWGCTLLSSATTLDEALWLQDQGVHAVIAQGLEAGGHRGHFLDEDLSRQPGTLALVPQLARALQVPVIAAGGLADAAGIAAARALGAQGVQLGTSFLLCDEALTSKLHRQALQEPQARHTALSNCFTGRPARGIVNRLMREQGPLSPAAPAFPLATAALAPLRAAAEARGLSDFSPLWCGQNASGCRAVPAAELVRQLVAGFDDPTPVRTGDTAP